MRFKYVSNMHKVIFNHACTQLSSETRDPKFDLCIYLHPYFICASRERYGLKYLLHRLILAIAFLQTRFTFLLFLPQWENYISHTPYQPMGKIKSNSHMLINK